jgi:predicted methyltransferase
MNRFKQPRAWGTLLFTMAAAALSAAAAADLKTALEAAMASDSRTEAEVARDANRKPIETLTFFGLEEDMRVLELLPGGGWYTKLLAPVLEENGQLYVSIGTTGVERMLEAGQLSGVEVITAEGEFKRDEATRRFFIDGLSMDVRDLDMVLTFRNVHNFTPRGRADLNTVAFNALKSGGVYGVVDHTRRHMQGDHSEVWRRIDPVQVIKEVEAAGFEFVDYSDLHYRPDDTLEFEVGRRTVTGNTDRFTLLFRKP